MTLSLTAIAEKVSLASAADVEHYLLDMIADGEIFASINQLTGTVSFHEDREQVSGCQKPGTFWLTELGVASVSQYFVRTVQTKEKEGRTSESRKGTYKGVAHVWMEHLCREYHVIAPIVFNIAIVGHVVDVVRHGDRYGRSAAPY